jgi:hypothetical protein
MVYHGLAVKHLGKAVLITIFSDLHGLTAGCVHRNAVLAPRELDLWSRSFFNDLAKRIGTSRARNSSRERTWNFNVINSKFDQKLEFGAS